MHVATSAESNDKSHLGNRRRRNGNPDGKLSSQIQPKAHPRETRLGRIPDQLI
jgi:hypothetical protein